MKKLIMAFGLLCYGAAANSQTYDYTSAVGWTTVGPLTFTVPGGCALLPATLGQIAASNITISGGQVNFNNVKGAYNNRVSRPLLNTYNANFNLDFDIQITNTASGKGFFPIALTSQDLNPIYTLAPGTCGQLTPMDVLAVHCATAGAGSNTNLSLSLFAMDNGVVQNIPGNLPIEYDRVYFARLQVFDNQMGEFSIYSNASRTNLIDSYCFNISSNLNGLNVIQHSANAGSSYARTATGWLDNADVYRNVTCCTIDIDGPSVVCGGDTTTFTVQTNGTDADIQVPTGVTYVNNGNGTFTITDWGTTTGTITITATSNCKCEEIEAEIDVTVLGEVPINIVGLGTTAGGTQLTNFSAVSDPTPSGTIHTWELWESNPTTYSLITMVRGPVSLTSTGGGTTFSVNATTPTILYSNKAYTVLHKVSYPGGCKVDNGYFFNLQQQRSMAINHFEMAKLVSQIGRTVNNARIGDVTIFPNPTSSIINVESKNDIGSWEISDMNGRLLRKENSGRKSIQIDMSNYSKGIYIIKIYSADGVITEKIIFE